MIGSKMITVLREKVPAKIPWKSLKVELVVDCSSLPDSQAALDQITSGKGSLTPDVEHVIICNPSQPISGEVKRLLILIYTFSNPRNSDLRAHID